MIVRAVRWLAWAVIWLAAIGCLAWAFGTLAYDFPLVSLRRTALLLYGLVVLCIFVFLKGNWRKLIAIAVAFGIVLSWWLTLKPSNLRNWQPDVAQAPWAAIEGDIVTLHNVRNCDYRTETDYTPHWENRKMRLSKITGIDIAINYWGSPWMAHPILSFQFADAPPICFSIETRKEIGESYSAIGGLYRQYELIYIAADERDVIRVRTNYRQGEDVYLYHTTVTPDQARVRFLDYINALNTLHDHPRWYNAVTTNCTTSIRSQHAVASRSPWDWRILLNGKMDEMMYEHHVIGSGALPFAEFKKRSLVNPKAKAADRRSDFSKLIRENLPR
jgi:hypothetical protein